MSDKRDEREVTRRKLLALGGAAGAGLLLGGQLLHSQAEAKSAKPQGKRKATGKKPHPKVPRRKLGKTGQEIPILLVGGGVDFDPVFDPKLAEALAFGVNYIDTADCYNGGKSELAVGAFHSRAKLRNKLWITSKSDEYEPDGFAKIFAQSLQRLQTSYIDLYFLHALSEPEYLNRKLLKVVERLKKQGKLRHFGFSCHDGNVAEMLQAAARTPWVEAVMFRYNFRRYGDKALNKAIDACVKANVGLIAMKTQGSAASFKERWVPFKQTGKWNKHQAVLKAVWADERISAAVSAMDTLEIQRQNIAAALDRGKLSQAETEELQRYARATRSMACDGCDHLCGAALAAPARIGETLRYLMYHDAYGQPEKARALFAALPAEAQRQAAQLDFTPANAVCPHGLDVHWHMRRAARVLGA